MRNEYIDFLRFFGLALIILAHVGPPDLLFQLRNFDVPLMVLVSALSFSASYKISPTPPAASQYYNYIWSRVKRLLLPVWLFLTAFFAVTYLFQPLYSSRIQMILN